MAALAADKVVASRNLGAKLQYPVVASDIIYAGSIVMIDSAGYANPAAASVTNNGCVGIAVEKADNASGSAGAVDVEVQEGEFLLDATTAAQTIVGDLVYAEDDQTIDETQGSNEPRAGIATEFVSASSVWVRMGIGLNV